MIERETGKGGEDFDAEGGLVTESFVISHLHLDKVHTAARVSKQALTAYQSRKMDTRKAIRLAATAKENYSEADIVRRARRVLELAISYGVTHIRAFADTDTISELKGVKALLRLREEFGERLELQIVAFPQQGVESDAGAEEYIERALEIGADVVGGIPWLEKNSVEQQKHVDKMFALARKYDKPVAMLVDDAPDPSLKTLEILARKTMQVGWYGRVQACHARAMGAYPRNYAIRIARMCSQAGIGISINPHTGPQYAPLDILNKAGVNVALGQDDCFDAYYPYGRCNMLEVAFLCSHLLRIMSEEDMENLYDMITVNPAKIIGLRGFRFREGNSANLVVFKEKEIAEVFAYQSGPALVLKNGTASFPRENKHG